MATALYLTVSKIALLSGASDAVNNVLVGTVPVVILLGSVLAFWLKAQRPETYAALGEEPTIEEEDLVSS